MRFKEWSSRKRHVLSTSIHGGSVVGYSCSLTLPDDGPMQPVGILLVDDHSILRVNPRAPRPLACNFFGESREGQPPELAVLRRR